MEEIKKELEKCKKEKEEILNSFKRERADFINYKKDEMERAGKTLNYFLEETVSELLPVLDSFALARKEAPEKKEGWMEGFLKIENQLKEFLKSLGVEEIDASLGKDFDPNFHEAVEVVEGEKSQTINEEIQKGYLLKGRVIRPSKVKVVK
ncbi:MAG: nucleotide exchange factor GrpE [Candidatus Pacebacteria bacterium]|jgi:molecular chaperone GrpE|nr:nucleotide exchange factor GrpE [Candidatus Paceibacterota bacterium]MDD3072197.1 nucleotide exchange factor GrpE [Candidatus Paceibacterota bacterium]MDD3729025.1 nucleotide exchange factor GrpE [Candidatus Paceibacterota bacterium]MDD4201154.1 nucleotide exchange factor GrpE [Candidatus Paceibacterota bacterium]MDD4467250.1 nucleotide exchange factor GrpE [Candidatus Paceibacterota bacterium]